LTRWISLETETDGDHHTVEDEQKNIKKHMEKIASSHLPLYVWTIFEKYVFI